MCSLPFQVVALAPDKLKGLGQRKLHVKPIADIDENMSCIGAVSCHMRVSRMRLGCCGRDGQGVGDLGEEVAWHGQYEGWPPQPLTPEPGRKNGSQDPPES